MKNLTYYYDLVGKRGKVTVELDQQEKAVLLQAYDYGINELGPESRRILDRVISKMKFQIWP